MTQHHETRHWSAKLEAHHKLVVHGEVQTLNTNQHPELKEAVPQGINPRILLLVLDVPQSPGAAGDIVSWKGVTFHKHASAHEYDEVQIRGAVAKAVTIKVERVMAA